MSPQLPAPIMELTRPLDAGFAALSTMMASFNTAATSVLSGLQAPFRVASPESPIIMAARAPLEAIKAMGLPALPGIKMSSSNPGNPGNPPNEIYRDRARIKFK